MPSLSASSQSNACTRSRALTALVWVASLCALACRDTREDTNYCSTCASGETVEGVNTDMSVQEGGTTAPATADPSSAANGGIKTGPNTTTPPAQAGAGRAAQGAAATSGASNMNSGVSATAGTRAGQAGTAARSGSSANSGGGGTAANSGNTSNPARDAGTGTGDPEPKPDAGNPTPMPCNGTCPAHIPVCDESKSPAECVQCSSEDQRECKGETRTCDLEQNKCVQCTLNDARNCPRDAAVCNAQNRCVHCSSELVDSCPAAQPICIDESRCVECRTNNDCRDGTRNMCNTDGVCVTCMTDAQCMDPAAPRCDAATNGCIGCEGPSDCAGRFPGTPYCDKQTKACVACLPDSDTLCEAGLFCDPNSHTCVPGTPTRRNCDSCNTDKDCAQSPSIAACIEHENGRHCFATAPGAMPRCESGYMPASVQGRSQLYCLPISPVTCQAIADAVSEKMCMKPEECSKGSQCQMPELRCRLTCNATQQCPAPLTCDEQNRVCKKR